jgi:hypothetical protein
MIEGIEELYQIIADKTAEAIPPPWTLARIEAVFFSDSIDFFGEYWPAQGNPRSLKVVRDVTRAFESARQKFKEAGQKAWGQATFELHSDGKFNMKWGYENCDENGDTIWNADEWQRHQDERRKRLTVV